MLLDFSSIPTSLSFFIFAEKAPFWLHTVIHSLSTLFSLEFPSCSHFHIVYEPNNFPLKYFFRNYTYMYDMFLYCLTFFLLLQVFLKTINI